MAEGIDAASFEFYEGIRIFVPGAVAVGLAGGVGVTFDISWLNPTQNSLGAVVAALLVGLVLYFIDAPARAAVIKPLQPTETVRAWKARGPLSTLNTYLLLLDTEVPPAIRARALYMGSMFRIGYESIYLVLLGGLTVLLSPIAIYDPSALSLGRATPTRLWFMGAAIACYLFALWRHRGGPSLRPPATAVGDVPTVTRNLSDYVVLALAIAAFLGLVVVHERVQSRLILVPCIVVALLWSVRYFRGYPPSTKGENRRPIDVVHAVLLALIAVLMAMGTQFMAPPRARHLSFYEEAAWCGILIVGLVLITARGHERRLRGAYASQNSWLISNRTRILETNYGQAPAAVPAQATKSRGWCRRKND